MRQMGLEGVIRTANRVEKSGTWKMCDHIFRAAHSRIENYARHVRQVIERGPEQHDLYLSEGFDVRYQEMIEEIQREWILERPDLKLFSRLVADWEDLCMTALRAELKREIAHIDPLPKSAKKT